MSRALELADALDKLPRGVLLSIGAYAMVDDAAALLLENENELNALSGIIEEQDETIDEQAARIEELEKRDE